MHEHRIGAIAAFGGAATLFFATLLHPMSADPNDPVAAFTEYAADRFWVASHLGQFLGVYGGCPRRRLDGSRVSMHA